MNLEKLALDLEGVIVSDLGLKLEKSKFFQYSKANWDSFLKQTNSDNTSQGVFLPRDLSAHVNTNSEFLSIYFLHEYFGHGLFCEYARVGQKIVDLEKSLENTEKLMLGLSEVPKYKKLQLTQDNSFLKRYLEEKENLSRIVSQNLQNYEGFAMWMEHYLSKVTNQENLFEKKMNTVTSPSNKELFERFYTFSENYGSFALISDLGFPKFYDNQKIVNTLKKVYKDDFSSIKLAILYGSRKPYSDIDLFIVSDNIKSSYNHWLDIFAKSGAEFEEDLANLSVAVTDPLFSGEAIIGSNYQKHLKQRVLTQPINRDSIRYNMKWSRYQGNVSRKYPNGSREQKITSSYANSFKKNAEALESGKKLLTLKNTL